MKIILVYSKDKNFVGDPDRFAMYELAKTEGYRNLSTLAWYENIESCLLEKQYETWVLVKLVSAKQTNRELVLFETKSHLMVYLFRALIKEKIISHSDFKLFAYTEQGLEFIELTGDGRHVVYDQYIGGLTDDLLDRLLS